MALNRKKYQNAVLYLCRKLKNEVSDVVADFRATDLYEEKFLADLENGLRKSSYAKK